MPTKEQESWTSSFLGIDVVAVAGALKTVVQSLPGSAMLPDCKPVKGKVPGPAEHLLCATHGHIVDVKQKKIIAISLDQYKLQKMGAAKPVQPAVSGQASPPPGPAAAPGPAPLTSTPSAVDAGVAKSQAEAGKIIEQMQSETKEFESVRAAYDELAGGGRVNRAVSWISDKLGGADDPGEELSKIGYDMMMEHGAGMAAVGTLAHDAAQKHLATMKALNEKAQDLWQKYAGDTGKGAGRAVTGLTVVSKAGDIATMGLNVVAPGTGQILSVAKNVSVTGSKLAFGEKVNWAEFSVDMAFDLFVGKEGGQINKAAQKLADRFVKKLAPKVTEAVAKKWGLKAAAKTLGGKVSEKEIHEYFVATAEELIKFGANKMVTPIAEHVVESAKDTDITNGQLANMMLDIMTDPSGQFAITLSDKLTTDIER